jgi:hypothetical protein
MMSIHYSCGQLSVVNAALDPGTYMTFSKTSCEGEFDSAEILSTQIAR